MKKTILTLAVLCFCLFASAQELVSKKGFPIKQEKDDWGLSIDAVPFLEYAGNLFHGSDASNAPTWSFLNGGRPMTISGLLVKDANTAYRAKLRLGFNKDKVDTKVPQTQSPDVYVTNTQKVGYHNITLGAGLQKMRGKGRLQGIYGAEALIGLDGLDTTYSYGNPLSDQNQTPRTTENKQGSSFSFGLRGFIGCEFFFAPKISLSGEFGIAIGLRTTGEGEVSTETWDTQSGTGVSKTVTLKTGKSSHFGIDNDNSGGALNLTFYF